MHNNFHFLARLAPELNEILAGAYLVECFSQEAEQLILGFDNKGTDYYIKADLKSGFSTLSFPENFAKAKAGARNYFYEVADKKLESIEVAPYERCLFFNFENGYCIIFKLFGDRSNILLANEDAVLKIFKKKLFKDLEADPNGFGREVVLDYDSFSVENLKSQFPTLGKPVHAYLKEKEIAGLNKEEQWSFFLNLLQEMESGPFYLTEWKEQYHLLLMPLGNVTIEFDSAIEALNAFTKKRGYQFYLESDKQTIFNTLNSGLRKAEKYIKEAEQKLNSMLEGASFKELADILMANLYNIPAGAEKVKLLNFYTNEDVEIKLDKKLKPQIQAEKYYRKAKNQNIELNKLTENIKLKEEQISRFTKELKQLEEIQDIRTLRKEFGHYLPGTQSFKKEEENAPRFKEFFQGGFKILVGRNSRNNDELTLHEAKKDDYWLHAKDVSGSHVVIKHQPGKNVPKDVKEYAASLAAFYSKRKTDSLCPVIFTQKKFVRKVKGTPAGSVKVEKEEIILIEPARM